LAPEVEKALRARTSLHNPRIAPSGLMRIHGAISFRIA